MVNVLKVTADSEGKVINSTYSTWTNLIRSMFPKTQAQATITMLDDNDDIYGGIEINYNDDRINNYIIESNKIIGMNQYNETEEDVIKQIFDKLEYNESLLEGFEVNAYLKN